MLPLKMKQHKNKTKKRLNYNRKGSMIQKSICREAMETRTRAICVMTKLQRDSRKSKGIKNRILSSSKETCRLAGFFVFEFATCPETKPLLLRGLLMLLII